MLGSSHSLLVLLLSPNALEDICRSWYQLVAIGYLSLYKHFGFLSLMHPRVWAESGFADLITVAHPSAIFRELAICLRNRLLASQNLNQHIRKRSAICISTVSVGQTYVFSIFLTNSIPFKERAVMLHKHILCCSSVPKEWNSIHFFIYRDQVNNNSFLIYQGKQSHSVGIRGKNNNNLLSMSKQKWQRRTQGEMIIYCHCMRGKGKEKIKEKRIKIQRQIKLWQAVGKTISPS